MKLSIASFLIPPFGIVAAVWRRDLVFPATMGLKVWAMAIGTVAILNGWV